MGKYITRSWCCIWSLVGGLLLFFYLPDVIYVIPAHEGWLAITRGWASTIALLVGLYFFLRHLWRRAWQIGSRSDVYRLVAEGLCGLLFAAFVVWSAQVFWSIPPVQTVVTSHYSVSLHQSSNKGDFFRNYFLYVDDCPDPYHHYVSAPKPLHFAINASTATELDSHDAPQTIAVTHRGRTFFAYHAVGKASEKTSCPVN